MPYSNGNNRKKNKSVSDICFDSVFLILDSSQFFCLFNFVFDSA